MSDLKITWQQVSPDRSGNPRYVCHFFSLNTRAELDSDNSLASPGHVSDQYSLALKRARRIGGKKFHNKVFGGGIVFATSNLRVTEKEIARVLAEDGDASAGTATP